MLSPTIRPPTPIDQDLQALYNEVWAGFNTEEKEEHSVYGASVGSPTMTSPVSATSSRSELPSTPSGGSFRNSSFSASVRSSRRLPQPPTPNSSSPIFGMPEPEPYHDPAPTSRSSHISIESTSESSGLLRRATANRRVLPPPPPNGSDYGSRRSRPGTQESMTSGSGQQSIYGESQSPPPQYGQDVTDDTRRGTSPALGGRGSSMSYTNGARREYGYEERATTPTPTSDYSSGDYSAATVSSYPNASSASPYSYTSPATSYSTQHSNAVAGPSTPYYPQSSEQDEYYSSEVNVVRRTSDMLRDLASSTHILSPTALESAEMWEEEEPYGEESFINISLLSHLAVQLRDSVKRATHVKGSIPYPNAFTGKDIVSTIQGLVARELAENRGIHSTDRRAALQVARSLQGQLFFYEVEWGGRVLQDGVEDVYMFLDDNGDENPSLQEELPTGVVTMLTTCYVPTCGDEDSCYSFACPRRGNLLFGSTPGTESTTIPANDPWASTVPKEVLDTLPASEINRQTIIHKVIHKETQYIQDLDLIESSFIIPLRRANPPIISPSQRLNEFIDEVFGNILDLRECNRRLLEVMYVRQREQAHVIQRIGDIFLTAATEFRYPYPLYIGQHPLAERRLKEEIDTNSDFRLFLEKCARETSPREGETIRLDLKHLLNRPVEHLQKYPVLLDAIFRETTVGNPDADYLVKSIEAIKNLQSTAQLRTFQSAMGKGPTGKWEWHDLVSVEVRAAMTKEDAKRQAIIFELIKGEMAYVKDLENIELMYIQPLRSADPPVVPTDRINQFIKDVFHNVSELHEHHRKLVETFHEIQLEQHPTISSITAAMFDAALNFRPAYMEYIPNYPIAAYRIDDEMANNPAFATFVNDAVRHPDAHRLDMKNFINRPIPRLLRYELLLKGILDETPNSHDDRREIPQVLEVIKSLGKDTEPGVVSSKQKVELWRYNSNLVYRPGESVDLDLLDEHRSLIYSGKLLRQPESGLGWSELYVLLFDNYLVLTKPKERDGITKYQVNRRPIPLDLLTLVNFTDPPTQRSTSILRTLRVGVETGPPAGQSPESANDARSVFPCTVHHNGRMGGPYILYAESAQSRTEWKQKLEEAIGIRKVVQESNKVFEIETLSSDTFLVPAMVGSGMAAPAWSQDNSYTGRVTCSVPFNTPDGRGLVAIGCAEGVWIGFRHDPKSMRRVLHLKLVTQCAMLEEFGIFLVLADKSLFAYHIEALVPSSPQNAHASQVPQKLNGNKDVHFFSVGTLHGRTLIIYMKRKNTDSIFRVLEPVGEKINEKGRAQGGLSTRFGLLKSNKSEWFRIYRDFFLPSESYDLVFLKAKIAILCGRGFEIMDLHDFKSVSIPQCDDQRFASLARRCEACRPIGMFRSKEDEFLLCYNEFGLYVDKHGDPSRTIGTVEWEGNADRVALHAPYILLFDSRFIEVRHLETGRLCQIIPGSDVRCIWDGRGSSSNVAVTPGGLGPGLGMGVEGEEMMIQDAQVHVVMNASDAASLGPRALSRAMAQHVFELLPTVPLYVPGALSTPPGQASMDSYPYNGYQQNQSYISAGPSSYLPSTSQGQYVSQTYSSSSYSPPQSPGRESGSWR